MNQRPLRFGYSPASLSNSPLIAVWRGTAAQTGSSVAEYLVAQLSGKVFCEIDPLNFFSLRAVAVQDSLVDFPESKFWDCRGAGVFESHRPDSEHYRFLNLILDVATQCKFDLVYTVEEMPSLVPHTAERRLMSIVNFPELKRDLKEFDIETDSNFSSPPSQPPTLSSFLLWTARKRRIRAIGLWVGIPFYLSPVGDPQAQRRVIELFNRRHDLGISLESLNTRIAARNEELEEARRRFPKIDRYIEMLETGRRLNQQEAEELATGIGELLKREE